MCLAVSAITGNSGLDLMYTTCTSLKVGATIPMANFTTQGVCGNMYRDCTSLEHSGSLLQVNAPQNSYAYCFTNCSKLTYIATKMGGSTPPYTDYNTLYWISGVTSSTGTFVAASNASWTPIYGDTNSVPSGWTFKKANQLFNWVDFGLPSNTMWADRNIGATSPEDSGYFFSYANTMPIKKGWGYNFNQDNYNRTIGKHREGQEWHNNYYHDAGLVNTLDEGLMAGKDDWTELINYCDWELTTVNSVKCWKVMKKSNHSVYIIIPLCGYYNGTTLTNANTNGYYWGSSRYVASGSNGDVVTLTTSSKSVSTLTKYYGLPCRIATAFAD